MRSRRIFRFTSWLVAIMGVLATIFFLLGAFNNVPATSDMWMSIMASMICAGFPIAMVMAISGIASRTVDKDKMPYVNNIVSEDERLDNILNKLSDEEQDYIEGLIASKRMGIADDGELTSLDDLLDDEDDYPRMNLTQ